MAGEMIRGKRATEKLIDGDVQDKKDGIFFEGAAFSKLLISKRE